MLGRFGDEGMASMLGRFLGVGVDAYADASLRGLEHAVSDVTELLELLGLGVLYDGDPLANPTGAAKLWFRLRGRRLWLLRRCS
jgi:hypothetical protein